LVSSSSLFWISARRLTIFENIADNGFFRLFARSGCPSLQDQAGACPHNAPCTFADPIMYRLSQIIGTIVQYNNFAEESLITGIKFPDFHDTARPNQNPGEGRSPPGFVLNDATIWQNAQPRKKLKVTLQLTKASVPPVSIMVKKSLLFCWLEGVLFDRIWTKFAGVGPQSRVLPFEKTMRAFSVPLPVQVML
jgi:hypothetical protein